MQSKKRKLLDLLPKEFVARMSNLLADQAERFLNCYEKPPTVGVRWNSLCCDRETFFNRFPYRIAPLSYCQEGFLLEEERGQIGKHPYHNGGLYYLQEPSAMTPVVVLDPRPGERVLDLCAAPGGKSTQIAARLQGRGILVSNEIIPNRARILLSNFERMGVSNGIVFNSRPKQLVDVLPGWFDKVLVDAPCSGEGMFRKHPEAAREWTVNLAKSCAIRQREILDSAGKLVRPGGVLVYSTCTFSVEENEEQIFRFLQEHPDFRLVPITLPVGQPSPCRFIPEFAEIEGCWRIFPFDVGEGHFVAKLQKISGEEGVATEWKKRQRCSVFESFWKETFSDEIPSRLLMCGDRLFLLPEKTPKELLSFCLRPGVFAGEVKKGRFVPAHHLSHSNVSFRPSHRCVLPDSDEKVIRYLRGEQLEGQKGLEDGYCGIFVDGVPLGFAKKVSSTLKNHYPKGLRAL